VATGSVQFTIEGGLVASGLGLVVMCAAGLVAAPVVGPLAGGLMTGTGLLDLAMGWKQTLAEVDQTPARPANAQARKAEAEALLLELQAEAEKAKRDRESARTDFPAAPGRPHRGAGWGRPWRPGRPADERWSGLPALCRLPGHYGT
jgi:hypothetical protein